MASDQIQPLGAIKPVCDQSSEDAVNESQARKDYREGRTYLSNGDYGQAAISLHNALKGFEEAGDIQGVANAVDRLGDTCMAKEEYAMAIEHFKRAAEICEQEDDSFSVLSLNKKLAAAYRKQGEPDKSFELLFDMLEHYRLTNNPKGAVEALIVIGELYVETGQNSKAADTYRTVSSIHANYKHERMAKEFAQKADELEQA
ncbi:tetratricopeptide repeat protein [Desulfogranum japonicum]|uniref:tetratricopeptide repeat protein n=1 Tax=Desulfogranum japonicum TaxID=231447 RepID=UPI00041ADFFB|nr:tetratricopeptide repeat protein [Desulfogranum japonicum]